MALKKAVLEQGRQLSEAHQWVSLVDHTVMAWGYIRATPVWDNPPHNNVRKQCFRALAANCMHALKHIDWEQEDAKSVHSK